MGASNRPAVKERHCCSTMCKNPTNCLAPLPESSRRVPEAGCNRVVACRRPVFFVDGIRRPPPRPPFRPPRPGRPPRRLQTASRRHKSPYPSHSDRGGHLPRTGRNLPCWTRRRTPVCCARLEPGRIQPVRTSPRQLSAGRNVQPIQTSDVQHQHRGGSTLRVSLLAGSDLHAHQT